MIGQQNVLDPRLSGNTLPPPPPHFGGGARQDTLKQDGGLYAQQTPQPYYQYPSPQTTQTPQQSDTHSANQSQQTSPPGAYPGPLDKASGSPDQGGELDGQNGDDPKRPRACEACRGLKVRCDQDPAHPEIPCKRCAKAGRQCVITQPSRKRQKKADSRVAELEKKLDALTAVLHQQQAASTQYGTPPQTGGAPQADMMQARSALQYPP